MKNYLGIPIVIGSKQKPCMLFSGKFNCHHERPDPETSGEDKVYETEMF